MSYDQIATLRDDEPLRKRVETCVFEQANVFKDDGRPDIAALAYRHLRDPLSTASVWMPWIANAPGFSDHAADTTGITDGMLLSAVQAGWPTISALYYNSDGTPS